MKAVVLELRDSSAAVLDKEGIVSIIPDRGYRVGQVLSLSRGELAPRENFHKRPLWRRAAGVAAACLVLLAGSGGYMAVATPVSAVTVEGEASVQMELNVLGRVVRVKALNDPAKDFQEDLREQVKGKPLDKAVELTLDLFEEKGYFGQEEETPLVMTVEGNWMTDTDRMENVAEDTAKNWSDAHPGSLELEMLKVTEPLREEALREGTTPGQVFLEQRRQEREGGDQGPAQEEPMNAPMDAPGDAPEGPGEMQDAPGAPAGEGEEAPLSRQGQEAPSFQEGFQGENGADAGMGQGEMAPQTGMAPGEIREDSSFPSQAENNGPEMGEISEMGMQAPPDVENPQGENQADVPQGGEIPSGGQEGGFPSMSQGGNAPGEGFGGDTSFGEGGPGGAGGGAPGGGPGF